MWKSYLTGFNWLTDSLTHDTKDVGVSTRKQMKKAGYIRATTSYDQSIFDKTKEFAEACFPTNQSEYAKRNQKNTSYIVKQTIAGKIAEVIVERWIGKMGFDCEKGADFEIYSAGKKDFSSDLIVSGEKAKKYFDIDQECINISCKACFRQFGPDYTEYANGDKISVILPKQFSWTYQLRNNGGIGGHDNGDHHLYIFSVVNFETMKAGAYAWVRRDFVDKMFIRPFMPHLKNNKLVIQQKTCGGLKRLPCGIDEILDENYEPKECI